MISCVTIETICKGVNNNDKMQGLADEQLTTKDNYCKQLNPTCLCQRLAESLSSHLQARSPLSGSGATSEVRRTSNDGDVDAMHDHGGAPT